MFSIETAYGVIENENIYFTSILFSLLKFCCFSDICSVVHCSCSCTVNEECIFIIRFVMTVFNGNNILLHCNKKNVHMQLQKPGIPGKMEWSQSRLTTISRPRSQSCILYKLTVHLLNDFKLRLPRLLPRFQ